MRLGWKCFLLLCFDNSSATPLGDLCRENSANVTSFHSHLAHQFVFLHSVLHSFQSFFNFLVSFLARNPAMFTQRQIFENFDAVVSRVVYFNEIKLHETIDRNVYWLVGVHEDVSILAFGVFRAEAKLQNILAHRSHFFAI